MIWVNPMAYGKIDPLVADQIEQSIAKAVLPLQQTIARLETAVDMLKRERGIPPEQLAEPKEETTGRS